MCDFGGFFTLSATHSCAITAVLAVQVMGYTAVNTCELYEVVSALIVQVLVSMFATIGCQLLHVAACSAADYS
jgi:hypothetical protein